MPSVVLTYSIYAAAAYTKLHCAPCAEETAAEGSTMPPEQETKSTSQPAPVPCPEQEASAAEANADQARKTLKALFPLSRWYMGDPAFVRFVLGVHGLFLEPKGDDFVLRGAERLHGQNMTELFSFICRHDRALNILNAQLHKEKQA